jgi:hypothetical protein
MMNVRDNNNTRLTHSCVPGRGSIQFLGYVGVAGCPWWSTRSSYPVYGGYLCCECLRQVRLANTCRIVSCPGGRDDRMISETCF